MVKDVLVSSHPLLKTVGIKKNIEHACSQLEFVSWALLKLKQFSFKKVKIAFSIVTHYRAAIDIVFRRLKCAKYLCYTPKS